jgi:hypothetical protein
MKSYLALGAAILVAVAAACGGATGNTGLTSATDADAGDDAGGSTDTDGGTTTGDPSDPLNAAATCTSGSNWTRGDRGSASMHPGVACIACHDANFGPSFSVAGTVYPTGHEPDDCNGASGITVVITDAKGQTFKIPTNSVGNFYSQANIATPYNAKVVSAKGERAMVASQTSGDCNSCHTQDGTNSAPGRITAP